MRIFIFTLFLIPTLLIAQNKIKIDYHVYNDWNSIKSPYLSENGDIIAYQIEPYKGDGYLYIKNTNTNTEIQKIERGKTPEIHFNNEYVVYTIGTQYDSIRQLKLDKVKKDKFPKDTLGIYWISGDSTELIPNITSFKQAKEGDWLAYLLTEDTRPDCPEKKCKLFKKKNTCTKPETTGKTLVLYNPLTQTKKEIYQVKDYVLNEKGTRLVYTKSLKGKTDSLSVIMYDVTNHTEIILSENQLAIQSLVFDKAGTQLAFLESNDTNKLKNFHLNYWHDGDNQASIIVDSLTPNMPKGWTVSAFKSPYFSKDGQHLFLGTNTIVEQLPEDTLLDSEKAVVDVWSWQDKKIQPMQLKQKKFEEKRTFLAVYHINSQKFIQLANDNLKSVQLLDHNNAKYALGINNENYQKEQSWEFPWKSDYYLVNTLTGENTLLKEGVAYGGILSPSGDYFVWYNGADSTWHSKIIKTNEEVNLTQHINANFASDNNGNPFLTYPEGTSGWVMEDGKEKLVVNSEYDIWLLDPSNYQNEICISKNLGKKNKIKYRLNTLEKDSTYLTLNNNLIHGFNTINKDEFYVKPNDFQNRFLETNHTFAYLIKAKKSEKIIFRMMNFNDYPELFSTSLNFEEPKQLTHTNPQQKDYNWGTVELVHWQSYKGLELDGLLYKPEDFDSTKQYPMIVYFYETYSDNIHRFYSPKPTASIIYPTEYISNGYIVFIPDIKYTPGHPAQSAYDCIVSGTDYLTQKYTWIDSTKMGLQGQSWGGYQTAQLITMTDKFKCGMAGAPVSNMFSAYGGIRWGSGMSREFQYEKTQSRIGCTIWDCPELYIENSPIFGLTNVHTPLLIMHNDGDGAVPWYQGIEMYMGMRRLNKPVWMLNYNGDQHNLMKGANREDLSIRMRQFFDFYLLDAPEPKWMSEGVKATNKGKVHIPE